MNGYNIRLDPEYERAYGEIGAITDHRWRGGDCQYCRDCLDSRYIYPGEIQYFYGQEQDVHSVERECLGMPENSMR